jgi:hypothetical protein
MAKPHVIPDGFGAVRGAKVMPLPPVRPRLLYLALDRGTSAAARARG